jgi:outer membrane receptor protein involved in Fe transport
MPKIARILLSFAALFLFAGPILGQTFRGGINGAVTDPTGAVVPNASVTAVQTSTNLTYQTVSSSAGEFSFTNLPTGSYTLTISSAGFSSAKFDKIQVEAGSPYVLAAKLNVSSAGTTVEVDAGAIALDTVSDIQATTLPEIVVQNLPNSGRDFTQMVSQTTGFAGFSTGGGAGAASVNGTRSNSVNWQIEGTDNNDLWWNIPAVNQGGVSAIAGVVFPIDAIESFTFVTTGSTTLGRNPGGTANLIIKSGGNSLHGTAYFSNHNEFFERKNPFAASKTASRLLDYGFSVGGPIVKDKFFFFLSGEHQNFLIGAESSATEPTLAFQAQAYQLLDFYGIPHNPVAANLLNGSGSLPGLWAASAINCPTGGTANNGASCASSPNYTASGDLTGHSFNGLIKLDAKLTDKDTLSARWFVGQGTQTAPTSSAQTAYFENAPIHVDNFSLIYNRVLTPTMTNQLSAGVSYFNQVFSDADTNFNALGLGLNTGVTDPALAGAPHIVIGPTGSGAGLTASNTGFDPTGVTAPSGRNDITGHLDEIFTWTKGRHQMNFGGEYRQAQVDDFYQTGQRGTLYFDGSQGPWNVTNGVSTGSAACDALATKNLNVASTISAPQNLADFLAGCINPSSSSIVLGNPKRQVFETTFAIYGQDAYQVSKRLNLNFGFRYDYEGPFHSQYPNLSIFDPTSATGLDVVGNNGQYAGGNAPFVYHRFWGAASPRVGFSWQVDDTGKTVLRGGYGFYYDSIYMKSMLQNNGAQNISVFGPGLNPAGSDLVANALANPAVIKPGVDIYPTLASTLASPAAGSVSISTFDPNFKPSDTQLWNLNLQHSVTNSVIWQIGYVGSKGTHLLGLFDLNPAHTNATGNGPDTTTRPYYAPPPAPAWHQNFGVIDEARSNLGSIYHSLQTTLNVQSFHGLTAQLAYTWSHALDYETGLLPYLPQDPTNEKAEYGNSDFDVRNTVTGYLDYAIPAFRGPKRLTHGWEVNSGFSLHGGTPYTVDASSNVSGNGDNADRAVQVIANPYKGVSHAIVDGAVQWFNPSAFVDPANGTYSPTRRGQNYNPGYQAVDVAAIKTTAITERVSAQFKANIYNIFNHTNLAPVGFPATGESGTIGSTIGPYLGNPTIGPGEPLNAEFALKIIF